MLGKFTDSFGIVIIATFRTVLTYTEDGEENPVEDVFGVILDEDWDSKPDTEFIIELTEDNRKAAAVKAQPKYSVISFSPR